MSPLNFFKYTEFEKKEQTVTYAGDNSMNLWSFILMLLLKMQIDRLNERINNKIKPIIIFILQ